MKRIILLFISSFICCYAFSQSREDLTGTWMHTDEDNSDGDLCVMKEYMDYRADGSCFCHGEMYMEINMDAETKLHGEFTFSAEGTWSLEDGVITYKFSPKSISVLNSNENNMPGILKVMLFNPMKTEIKNNLRKRSPAQIISFTSDVMVLKDTNDKDATEDTYLRCN